MPHRWRRGLGLAGLLVAPVAFLLVFFAWPVASIIGEGLHGDGRWDLSGVGDVLGDADLRGVAWFTLWQAAASTALTLVLALPAAHVLARYEFRGRRAVQALVTVPFVLPTVVVGAAFVALLGPRSPIGLDLHGSVWAILLAHAFFNHAVVVRTVGGLWEGLDPATEEAARVLGASPWQAVRAVTLPALRPAIVSAGLITFLFTFTSFGVVRLLGGPTNVTLEVEIYRQTADLLNLPVASVLALLQLVTVGVLLVVQERLARRWLRAGVALAPARRRRPRSTSERAWVLGNLTVMAVLLVTPLLVLVERSFRIGDHYGLAGWRALGERTPETRLVVPPLEALGNSLRFAVVATVVAVVLGGLAASALVHATGRIGRAVDVVLLLPLGTSAVTVGFGFLLALDEPVDLRASPWLVPLAQAVVALPFVVRTMTPVLRTIDPRLREAAAVLGASPLRAWREVDLPLVRRAAMVAAGFAFAISLGEFGATTVIARADAPTVPVTIDRLLGRPGALNVTQAFAMSTILMVCTALAVLLVDRVRTGERRPSSGLLSSARLQLAGITVRFGDTVAVDAVDLDVAPGEAVAIVGPSGCGKTTLLRAVTGLQPVEAGRVLVDGRDLAGVAVHRRGVGLMFQEHALFPHRDVAGNVAFGLRMQHRSPADVAARVGELLELVGLPGTERRAVRDLSGGERQRVALARTLAPEPSVLLLDEALGALDRTLRERLADDLTDVFRTLGLTVVAVTHDQREAFTLGDRLAVMDRGRLLQVGPPDEVWSNPRNARVAELLGLANVLAVEVSGGRAQLPWGDLPVPGPDGPAEVLVRPAGIVLDPTGPIEAVVHESRFEGPRAAVVLELGGPGGPPLHADLPSSDRPARGAALRVRLLPDEIVRLGP